METVKENKNVLLVVEIEPESSSINDSFGITMKRCLELQKKVNEVKNLKDANGKRGSLTLIMVEISKECKHANELAWICFIIGANVGESQANPLAGLMQTLGRGRTGNPLEG